MLLPFVAQQRAGTSMLLECHSYESDQAYGKI